VQNCNSSPCSAKWHFAAVNPQAAVSPEVKESFSHPAGRLT
jgi:hypothetical protein